MRKYLMFILSIFSVLFIIIGAFYLLKDPTSEQNDTQVSIKTESSRHDELKNSIEFDGVVYELDEASKALDDQFNQLDTRFNEFFDIIYTFDSGAAYEERQEKAKGYASQEVLDSAYFLDGKDKNGMSLIDFEQKQSEFLSGSYAYHLKDEHNYGVYATIHTSSSERGGDFGTFVHTFYLTYNTEDNQVHSIVELGSYEPHINME